MKIRVPGYLRRLIGFSLLVGMLPVAILGLFSYTKSSADIQEKVNEANMQLLLQTQMTVEQSLITLQHSSVRFANSPMVNMYIDSRLTPHDFRLVDNLQTELTALSGIQTKFYNPMLISINGEWAISNDGLGPASEVISSEEIDSFVRQQGNSFWRTDTGYRSGNDRGQIRLVVKIPLNSNNPSGLLLLETSGSEINKLVLKSGRTGGFVLLDEQSHVMAAEDETLLGAEWQESRLAANISGLGTPSGFLESEVGGDQKGISFIRSGYNGWTYLSLVSIREITKESRYIGWATLIICLLTMLVTGSLSLMGSFRMYKPVRSLYNLTAPIGGKNETLRRETDEFVFISERISKLRTSEDRLTAQLNRQIEPLYEFFVVKLLQGELRSAEIEEKMEMFGYDAQWRRMCTLAVQVDTLEGTAYEEKDRDLMLFAIKNIVGELLPPEQSLRVILSGQTVFAVLGGNQNGGPAYRDHVYACAEAIQQSVKSYLKLKVSIGVSRTCGRFEELPQAGKESLEALKYRVKLGHESILFIGDMETGGGQPSYPEQLENRLLDAIKQTDTEQAHQLLNEWMEDIFKSEMRIDECHIYLVRLLTQVIGVPKNSGESLRMTDLESRSVIDKLFELTTKEEIKLWFLHTVIDPVIRLLDERRGEKYRTISETVIAMIHEEYDTDLTLESCAARLQYHPSYIWRVLRKERGINFSEYLAQHRLEVAKGWLLETDMTVTLIAEKLRYNNTQNFIRYFRKMEGTSPGKYREACKSDAANTF
jgi:two-component system response regulator YesN